mmetsp:Transcript_41155/g.127092  ORF Transcript_41155/g.127092 Transcript_41155/m.127092 type:complete len:605 (-) Transcript_41155:22-1836(-)
MGIGFTRGLDPDDSQRGLSHRPEGRQKELCCFSRDRVTHAVELHPRVVHRGRRAARRRDAGARLRVPLERRLLVVGRPRDDVRALRVAVRPRRDLRVNGAEAALGDEGVERAVVLDHLLGRVVQRHQVTAGGDREHRRLRREAAPVGRAAAVCDTAERVRLVVVVAHHALHAGEVADVRLVAVEDLRPRVLGVRVEVAEDLVVLQVAGQRVDLRVERDVVRRPVPLLAQHGGLVGAHHDARELLRHPQRPRGDGRTRRVDLEVDNHVLVVVRAAVLAREVRRPRLAVVGEERGGHHPQPLGHGVRHDGGEERRVHDAVGRLLDRELVGGHVPVVAARHERRVPREGHRHAVERVDLVHAVRHALEAGPRVVGHVEIVMGDLDERRAVRRLPRLHEALRRAARLDVDGGLHVSDLIAEVDQEELERRDVLVAGGARGGVGVDAVGHAVEVRQLVADDGPELVRSAQRLRHLLHVGEVIDDPLEHLGVRRRRGDAGEADARGGEVPLQVAAVVVAAALDVEIVPAEVGKGLVPLRLGDRPAARLLARDDGELAVLLLQVRPRQRVRVGNDGLRRRGGCHGGNERDREGCQGHGAHRRRRERGNFLQ